MSYNDLGRIEDIKNGDNRQVTMLGLVGLQCRMQAMYWTRFSYDLNWVLTFFLIFSYIYGKIKLLVAVLKKSDDFIQRCCTLEHPQSPNLLQLR